MLREVSQYQIGLLTRTFDDLDLPEDLITRDRSIPQSSIAGFLVLDSPRAAEICARLARMRVHTDSRGTSLRFGPAPYLNDLQLTDAINALREAIQLLS